SAPLALLFDAVSTADPENFLTPVTLVISIATVLVSVIYGAVFFRQGVAGIGIGAASSSYFNSVNIGLPVSIYVIGDATHVVPIMLLQMMIYTPVILGVDHHLRSEEHTSELQSRFDLVCRLLLEKKQDQHR